MISLKFSVLVSFHLCSKHNEHILKMTLYLGFGGLWLDLPKNKAYTLQITLNQFPSRGEHDDADRESVTTNGAESFLTTYTSDTDAWEWDNDIGLANATDELEVSQNPYNLKCNVMIKLWNCSLPTSCRQGLETTQCSLFCVKEDGGFEFQLFVQFIWSSDWLKIISHHVSLKLEPHGMILKGNHNAYLLVALSSFKVPTEIIW